MSWNTSVVTNAGVGLLNESLAGHTLTIESAVGGAGTLEEEALKAAADVADPKQTFHLIGIEDVENGKRVGVQITNQGVAESYILHQIGVKARLEFQEPEELTLLFVLQDDRGVEIPAEAESPDFLFEIYGILTISNNANIEVHVDTGVVASVEYVDQTAAQKADLILSNLSNRQTALRNIGGRPNRNLLENWYFVGGGTVGQFPINQRGESSYTNEAPTHVNIIDRWALQWGTVALSSAGLSWGSHTGSGSCQFSQNLRPDLSGLAGKTVTFSMLGTDGALYATTFQFPETGNRITAYASFGGVSGLSIVVNNQYLGSGCSITLRKDVTTFTLGLQAMKLELGSVQTLAFQDEDGNWQLFETPDYAGELAKCQRYFKLISKSNIGVSFPGELSSTGTEVFFSVPCSTPMRSTPTVSISRLIVHNASGFGFDSAEEGATFSVNRIYLEENFVTVRLSLSKSAGEKDVSVTARSVGLSFLSAEL